MSSRSFSFSYDSTSDLYIRLFRTVDGYVFDFADNTWKVNLAACTTPDKAFDSEFTEFDGTGQSVYGWTLNLTNIHNAGDVQQTLMRFYDNAVPADADVAIDDGGLDADIQFGEHGAGEVVCRARVSVKSTAGSTAQISVWLERNGQIIDIDTAGGTTFTADAATDFLTSIAHGLINTDVLNLTNSSGALPAGLTTGTPYYVINKTADTFQVSLSSGGAAVNFTDNGTGTNKWHHPTSSFVMREHAAGADLFPAVVGTVADLKLDVFQYEKSTPAFVDDRQYTAVASITENGNSHTTTDVEVVIG